MWYYIFGIGLISGFYFWVKFLGEKVRTQLEVFKKENTKLRQDIANNELEIVRATTIEKSINRFKDQLSAGEFLGLDSGSKTVAEHTNEFPNEITGHQVDVWLYNNPPPFEEPARIIVAGHANHPVCRGVSAALSTTYFRKDDMHPDDFFVTGAGVLVNDEKKSLPKTPDEMMKYIQGLAAGEVSSMAELKRQLHNYEKITGLVNLHSYSIQEYDKAHEEIIKKIEEIFKSDRSQIFGNYTPDQQGILLSLPFFRYQNGKILTLKLTIDEKAFECAEFRKLEQRHHQTIFQEMKNDVKKRNWVYKEWLEKDERLMNQYLRMDPGERLVETITVKGQRDYSKASIVEASGPSEIISVQEYMDKHLKGLIEEDKRWLQRTEIELSRLEKHGKEAGLAGKLGYTLLIDSFLRGWPSIFFSNENERKLYDQWLAYKRMIVWEKIGLNLLEQGISPTNLLHTNIVFKVTNINNGKVEIEPNYFLLTNAYFILVNAEEKIVRYIHPWESRDLLRLKVEGNWISEKDAALQTENLLSRGLSLLDNKEIVHAKQYIALALRCDADTAFVKLISHWWNNLSKDTSELYKERVSDPYLKALLSGLSLPHDPNNDEVQARRRDLNYCIQIRPNDLSDPYVMLAIFEVYSDFMNNLKIERQKFEIHAKKRIEQIKDDFLKGTLLPEATQSALTKEDFEKLSDPRYFSSEKLKHEREQAFEKVFVHGLRIRIQELSKGTAIDPKAETIIKALQGIENQEFIKFGIAAYANGEYAAQKKTEDSLFKRVKSNPKAMAYINKAKEIEPELVDKILKEEQFQKSANFWKMVGSFSEIAKANQFVEMNNWIVQLLILWENFPKSQNEMDAVLKKYQEIKLPMTPEEESMTLKLSDVVGRLKQFVHSTEDNMYIPMSELRSIQADLLNTAAILYKKTHISDLMEGNKARVLIMSQNHAAYREAINVMTEPGRSLRLLTREIEGKIVDNTLNNLDEISSLAFKRENGEYIVFAETNNKNSIQVLRLIGLTEEDFEHIKGYFTATEWNTRILPVGENIGEMLLNTPMPHVPRVQRFAEVLKDPEIARIVTHIMAYSNRHLVSDHLVEEHPWFQVGKLRTTSEGYVIGGVHVDFQKIFQKFSGSR